MGILNVTPDSFWVGSRKESEAEIAERAVEIITQGGSIIDVGACSTRPGSEPASEAEELARLRFALPIIRREVPNAVISIDTYRPAVAQMCIDDFGVDIINDVSEGSEDMFNLLARVRVKYIIMSARASFEDTLALFDKQLNALKIRGFHDVILDPGYGFGKNIADNYAHIARQAELKKYGLPILAGVSRKRMVWQLLDTSPAEALNGTTVCNALCLLNGADILRVHDVREAVETIKIIEAYDSRIIN